MRARPNRAAVGRWIGRDKRLAIYMRDNFVCAYCHLDLYEHPHLLSLDHLDECKNHEPNNAAMNLVTCCTTCNSRRQHTPLAFWMKQLRAERKRLQLTDSGLYTAAFIRAMGRRPLAKHWVRAKALIAHFGWGLP